MSATDARREYQHAAVRNRLLRYAIELHAQRATWWCAGGSCDRAVCAVADANLRMLEQGLAWRATPAQYDWSGRPATECGANRRDVGSWEVARNRVGLAGPIDITCGCSPRQRTIR